MKKIARLAGISSALGALALSAGAALAAPPEMTEGFVCPVLNATVGEHNPNAVPIGEGHYSIIGPDVMIPVHATNGDGAGVPPGPHSEPGDTDYTAIWAN